MCDSTVLVHVNVGIKFFDWKIVLYMYINLPLGDNYLQAHFSVILAYKLYVQGRQFLMFHSNIIWGKPRRAPNIRGTGSDFTM